MMEAVDIRVCGRVRVGDDAADRAIGRGLARELLALLVLHRGRPLDVPTVVDALWPGEAPPTAPTIVHGAVSRLRRALGEGALPRFVDGYALDESSVDVDLWRGLDLLGAGDLAAARALLVEPLLGPYAERAWAGEAVARAAAALGADADGTGTLTEGQVGDVLRARPAPPDGALTRLVGRRRDLTTVRTALRRSRLVAVVGLGGVGKSRLVTEVLAEVEGTVVRVDLGRGSGSFVERAAGAVGAVPIPEEQTGLVVVGNLLEGVDLLVVDGCELDLDGTADGVAFLLRRWPRLRVLATSRSALGVPGEHIVPLLPFEDPGDPRGDAVELLLDRVQALGVPYVDGDRQRAAEICEACAGVPLAIELAAAGLLDSTRMPATTPARAPAVVLRHRIDGAVGGLTERGQLLARRVALLRTGATIGLVERLGVGAGSAAVRELLSAGLLGVEAGPSGRRFHLPDTVRDALLASVVDEDRVAAAGALAALASPTRVPLGAGPDLAALAAAVGEVENAHGVLRALAAAGQHAERLALARAFALTWSERGYNLFGGAELMAAAVACRDAGGLDPIGWAEVVAEYLDVLQSFEAAVEHRQLVERALDVAVAAGRDDLAAMLGFQRACALGYEADPGGALLALQDARDAAGRAGAEAPALRIRMLLAAAWSQTGDVDGPRAEMEAVSRRLVELGWFGQAARAQLGLAMVSHHAGDRERALLDVYAGEEHAVAGHARMALVLLRHERAELQLELAAGSGDRSRLTSAREALEATLEVADAAGQPRTAGMCRVRLGMLDADPARLAAAALTMSDVDGRCTAVALAHLHGLLPARHPLRPRLPAVVAELEQSSGMVVSDRDVATVRAVAALVGEPPGPRWHEQLEADLLDLAERG